MKASTKKHKSTSQHKKEPFFSTHGDFRRSMSSPFFNKPNVVHRKEAIQRSGAKARKEKPSMIEMMWKYIQDKTGATGKSWEREQEERSVATGARG